MKRLHKGFVLLALVAVLLAVLSGTADGQAKQLSPEEAVIKANKAEFDWYSNLDSKEAAEKVKRLFTGSRYDNVAGRVERAIKRGDKAKSAWNKVELVGPAEILGDQKDTAIVRTKETGELEWTPSGIRWPEHGPTKDLPHTYTLIKINGQWKVVRDEFEQ